VIKGRMGTGSGIPVLFLGLSEENVARLTAGKPIVVTPEAMRQLGLPRIFVALHYGRTEASILEELAAGGMQLEDVSRDSNAREEPRDRG
jgi:hypothetical protein